MNREQFIDALRRALYGKIDDRALAEHVKYYEDYIAQEMAGGRREEEILDELGDPRLLARTILETSGVGTSYKEYTVVEESSGMEEDRVHVHEYQGWKATAFMAVILFVVILIVVVVFKIFIALLPLLIVIAFLGWLAKKIWG